MEVIEVPVGSLIPDPNNARLHDEKNLSAIKGSLAKFGPQVPIIIDDKNIVISGNARLEVAKQLGLEKVPCVRTNLKSETEKTALKIAMNRAGELATWNMDVLGGELQALQEDGFEIEDIGFEPGDVDFDIGDAKEGLTDDDAVPEVEQNSYGVKRGDIWQLGEHRVMCGDSTCKDDVDRLMSGQRADMVFTDPPYGVDYDGGMKKREKLANDQIDTDIYAKVLPLYVTHTKDRAAYYIWYADGHIAAAAAAAAAAGLHISAQIIWVKNHAQFMSNARYKGKHEPCMYGYKKGSGADWFGENNEVTVWEYDRSSKNEYHPTQKPAALSERAIANSCPNGGIVADWFAGSGSTIIGSEKLGRKCAAMEIDEHYVSVIIQRWQDFTGLTAVKA